MMSPRRVVYVSDAAWYGGAERYLVRLGGHLDRTRFTPILVVPKRPGLRDFARDARASDFEVLEATPGPFAGFRDPFALLRCLRSARPDILHLNLPSSYDMSCGWAAALGRRCNAGAVVITEHIVDLAVSRRRALARRISHRWIDRFIAISEANRRIMVERHGVPEGRSEVILNGVPDPGPPVEKPEQPFVITCVGSLEARKGQGLLIQTLSLLVARGIHARLVFVGEGPDRPALETEVRTAGLAGHVRFAGHVDPATDEIRAAHVLGVPSLREGVPFVVLEGMACGAVVVAAELPGMGEIITSGRSGLIVGSRDPAVWADTLAGLSSDRSRLQDLARTARNEFERRFRTARMARDTESLYERVLT